MTLKYFRERSDLNCATEKRGKKSKDSILEIEKLVLKSATRNVQLRRRGKKSNDSILEIEKLVLESATRRLEARELFLE